MSCMNCLYLAKACSAEDMCSSEVNYTTSGYQGTIPGKNMFRRFVVEKVSFKEIALMVDLN